MSNSQDEMQPPSQSEMIRQTYQMVTDLHFTIYGNGKLGVKTKVDRLWVGGRLLLYVLGAVVTAFVATKFR